MPEPDLGLKTRRANQCANASTIVAEDSQQCRSVQAASGQQGDQAGPRSPAAVTPR